MGQFLNSAYEAGGPSEVAPMPSRAHVHSGPNGMRDRTVASVGGWQLEQTALGSWFARCDSERFWLGDVGEQQAMVQFRKFLLSQGVTF